MRSDQLPLLDTLIAAIPALAEAFMLVIGGAALVEGWHLFRHRHPPRYRRGVVVPPVAVIEQDIGGDR